MNAVRLALRHGVLALPKGTVTPFGARAFAMEGLKGYSESESAMENFYFSKEDERLLRKILTKAKAQSDVVDKHSAAGTRVAEESALKEILAKYNVSAEDLDKLLAWKHQSF